MKQKFKVGEMVVVKNTQNVKDYGGYESIGKTLEITEIHNSIYILANNEYGTNYRESDLKAVTLFWKDRIEALK